MSKILAHEQIAVRAYELFLERGGEHGYDVEDWIAAERELNADNEETKAVLQQEAPEISTGKTYAVASSGRSR